VDRGRAGPPRLQGDFLPPKHGPAFLGTQPRRRTVDVQLARICLDRSLVHRELAGPDVVNVAHADNFLDGTRQLHLSGADGCAPVHRGGDVAIDANELATRFEPREEVRNALGFGSRFVIQGKTLDDARHKVERLQVDAIEHPRFTWAYPPDAVRIDAIVD